MEDVFGVSIDVMIGLATIILIFIIGTVLIIGNLNPMFRSLEPDASTEGISPSLYNSVISHLTNGFNWFFYVILAIPFLYFIMKALYEREETSYYGG